MLKWLFDMFTSNGKANTVAVALAPLLKAQEGLADVITNRTDEATYKRQEVVTLTAEIADADSEVAQAESIKAKLDELLS